MSRRITCGAILAATVVLLIACQRQGRPVASKEEDTGGAPKYDVASDRHSTTGVTYISEVMPKPIGGPIDGKSAYEGKCAVCHQVTGQGLPGAFPPLVGSPYVTGDKTDRLASIMIYGLVGPIKVLGTTYAGAMTPQGAASDEELAAIATYVRSSWGNSASKVEPAVFAESRKKWAARGPFMIAELGEEP